LQQLKANLAEACVSPVAEEKLAREKKSKQWLT
jgi:hypothetical protein